MIRKIKVILARRSKTERVTQWAYFQDFPKEGAHRVLSRAENERKIARF